jgi:hypothetical protein
MRHRYYTLDGKTPVPTNDVNAWNEFFENKDARPVAETRTCGVCVSTVFLGLDHGFGDGPPQIFQTIIFGGRYDQYSWRYATWDEAEAGHAEAVRMVQDDTWWRRFVRKVRKIWLTGDS